MSYTIKNLNRIKSLWLITLLLLTIILNVGCADSNKDNEKAYDALKVHTWRLQCAYSEGDQAYDIHMPMIANAITEATKGKIRFELYAPGEICSPELIPAYLEKGLLEAGISAPLDCASFVSAAYAEQGIPYYWENGADVYEVFYQFGMLEYLRSEYQKFGIYYGMFVPNGAYNLMTTFPVHSAADLKGKKIRASTTYYELMKQLGAVPVKMSGNEIYMAMKLGSIDGDIYTIAEFERLNLKDVTDYVIEPACSGAAPVNFIISQEAWEELPPEIQEIVNETMQGIFMKIYQEAIILDNLAKTASAEYGTKYIRISPSEMKTFYEAGEKAAEVYAEKYPESKEGFDIIKRWKANKDEDEQ